MTTFTVTLAVIVALIIIGLFLNVYFFRSGVFQRRRSRRRAAREAQVTQRPTTAALDEQYYTSLGIGPTPSEGE